MSEINDSKTVAILAAAPGRLAEAERFLLNRGWRVHLRADLKSFMSDVANHRPRHALISIDYRHENLAVMRPLIERLYRTVLIDFAEDSQPIAHERLRASPSEHKLHGPLTGPGFERLVARLNAAPNESREGAEKLLRGIAREILGRVFAAGDGAVERGLNWTRHLNCVQVKTPVLSGHFVFASGSGKFLEAATAEALREAILAKMREIGLAPSEHDLFTLEVRKVEFKRWALKAATLIERTAHHGTEIAMAFFPAEEDLFSLGDSPDPSMARIALDEIRPESTVGFELYLHLPLNQKFVLYVSRGGWLSLRQQLGLQARGIADLHVKKAEAGSVFRDRMHRQLDRSIANFYETREPVTPAS